LVDGNPSARSWQFSGMGVIITDDLVNGWRIYQHNVCHGPLLRPLNAGVDLLLVCLRWPAPVFIKSNYISHFCPAPSCPGFF